MKVTRTNKTPTEVTLLVSADQFDLTPIKDHVLTHFADSVKVPGFREGTAPAALIEKYVSPDALSSEFIEHALNSLYGRAVDEQKIRPASNPQVSVKKFVPFTNLEFEASVAILGPIKLADYKNIKVARKSVEIAANEVNDVVKSLQARMAVRKDADRAAKAGDEAVIDFSGKDKAGQPVPNTEGKDIPVIIGSNTFIPGFEDNLVGLKAGDSKEFSLVFPSDYGVKNMQGKTVVFSVTIKKVSEVEPPKADDAFAAKSGPFKTLAELKADIKKQLKVEKQRQADVDYENEVIKRIVEKSDVTVPKSLVDEQIKAAEEQEKSNLAGRGVTWQEHLAEEGINEEQHRERQRPDAEMRVKAGLILSEIAEQEKIEVTPEEIQIRLQILKGQYKDEAMQAELDKPDNEREIAARLATEKTIAKVISYASK